MECINQYIKLDCLVYEIIYYCNEEDKITNYFDILSTKQKIKFLNWSYTNFFLMQYIEKDYKTILIEDIILKHCIQKNYIEIIEWALQKDIYFYYKLVIEGIVLGNVDLVKLIVLSKKWYIL